MIKVTGVRFRQAGKVYYFDPKNLKLERGSHVIVETARGIEYGTVIVPPKGITDDEVVQPLKAVIRVATPEDDRIEERNHEKEKEAYKICLEKIEKHGLAMKLVQAEYTFDNNKLLFYLPQTEESISVNWLKRSGKCVPYQNRIASDRCPG